MADDAHLQTLSPELEVAVSSTQQGPLSGKKPDILNGGQQNALFAVEPDLGVLVFRASSRYPARIHAISGQFCSRE